MSTMTEAEPAKSTGGIASKIFGIGNTGGQVLNLLAKEDLGGAALVAADADADALARWSGEKVSLAGAAPRGFGGGDPEVARTAAEKEFSQLRAACAGMDLVLIVSGLGGGTGTGASPVIARAAKEAGARVLAFVTSPFDWEGSRRQQQAQVGCQQLKAVADGIVLLENQKVLKLIDEKTSVVDAFKVTTGMLKEVVQCFWRLLTRPGLININFGDLCALLQGQPSEIFFATAEAAGENRSRDVVEKLFSNPVLEGGQVLNGAESVLVSVVGPPDLSLAEINRVMEQVNRHCHGAHLIMGASLDANLECLTLGIVATRGHDQNPAGATIRGRGAAQGAEPGTIEFDTEFHSKPAARPRSRFVAPAPELTSEKTVQLLAQQNGSSGKTRKLSARLRQGQLPLEIVSKGRFEKSEPTLHHGEDLDVPTYLRRGVPLN
jgi:cell division protein FtsZ